MLLTTVGNVDGCTLAKAEKKLHGTISSLTATRQMEILAVDFTLLARSTGGIENVPVLGCHGNDNVDLHVIKTLTYSRIILGKVTKFGGHSSNRFKFIQLFARGRGGGLGLNRLKITTTTTTLLTLSST